MGPSEAQVTGPQPPDSSSPTDRAALGVRGRFWPRKGFQWEMLSPGTGFSAELLELGRGCPHFPNQPQRNSGLAAGCSRG